MCGEPSGSPLSLDKIQWQFSKPLPISTLTEARHRTVLLTEFERYAVVTLNRPEQMNCLNKAMMDELAETVSCAGRDRDLRVLIVAGAGGVFSAGADLNEVAALDPATAYWFSRRGQSLLAALGRAAPVTIAAIDGHCLGGGLDIAMSCDLRFATHCATFQHPGTLRGIITGWGGTQNLPRLIGADAARRLLAEGNAIDAQEAFRIGLVNKLCENALEYSCEFADGISTAFDAAQLTAIKSAAHSRA
jgi:enoyl-CoA hydratase